MREPDWGLLPFPLGREECRCYAETPDVQHVRTVIDGTDPEPVVWLEEAAVDAFAQACGVSVGHAFIELGMGVMRWHRSGKVVLRDGQGLANLLFRGAPGLRMAMGYLGGCYILHLPRPGITPEGEEST
jgi:hypothetical protein